MLVEKYDARACSRDAGRNEPIIADASAVIPAAQTDTAAASSNRPKITRAAWSSKRMGLGAPALPGKSPARVLANFEGDTLRFANTSRPAATDRSVTRPTRKSRVASARQRIASQDVKPLRRKTVSRTPNTVRVAKRADEGAVKRGLKTTQARRIEKSRASKRALAKRKRAKRLARVRAARARKRQIARARIAKARIARAKAQNRRQARAVRRYKRQKRSAGFRYGGRSWVRRAFQPRS